MSEFAPPPEAIEQGSGDRSDFPKAGSFRELLAVAVPLVLSSGSISLMIAIDRLFLTWYSEEMRWRPAPRGGPPLDRDERVRRHDQLHQRLRRPI